MLGRFGIRGRRALYIVYRALARRYCSPCPLVMLRTLCLSLRDAPDAVSRTCVSIASRFRPITLSNTAQKMVAKALNRTLDESAARVALGIQRVCVYGRRPAVVLRDIAAPEWIPHMFRGLLYGTESVILSSGMHISCFPRPARDQADGCPNSGSPWALGFDLVLRARHIRLFLLQ